MNILFISSLFPFELDRDKQTKALYHFAEQWTKQGVNVQILKPVFVPDISGIPFKNFTKIFSSAMLGDIDIFGLPVLRIPYIRKYLAYPSQFFLKRRKYKPDVVVAHMNENFSWAWKIARYYNVPFVVGIHKSDIALIDPPNLKKKMDKLLSRAEIRFKEIFEYSTAIACRSKAIQRQLLNFYPQYNDKCFIAYSGIEAHHIINVDSIVAKMLTWKHKRSINIFSVAALIKIKNIDIVLQALTKLKGLDWSYTIIGDGPERNRLTSLVRQLGIEKNVHFKGNIPHSKVIDLLTTGDIFALVSAPETFGLVYLEAMARGNIVIGTQGWGIDGIIKHGENGFLCPPRNVEALYNIFNKIIFDLDELFLEKLLKKTHQTILHHTNDNAAKNYLDNLIAAVNNSRFCN